MTQVGPIGRRVTPGAVQLLYSYPVAIRKLRGSKPVLAVQRATYCLLFVTHKRVNIQALTLPK